MFEYSNPKISRASPRLRKRLFLLVGLILVSRMGVYIPVSPKIDTTAVTETLETGAGFTTYIDALTGGSIAKAGLFSLGIVPFINASIIMQLMTSVFPQLKKLSRDEGTSGRQKFLQYQKIVTLFFALVQAILQLTYIRPFVTNFDTFWLFENSIVLATGAIALTFLADEIDKLKLGNGTSILIFTNILSTTPDFFPPNRENFSYNRVTSLIFISGSLLLTILGIVFVQEAEMKLPINYTSRFSGEMGRINRKSYLPFKVNATGVMPIIFASSLLSFPDSLSRLSDNAILRNLSVTLRSNPSIYFCYTLAFIFLFNYLYTLLQFDPNAVSENLKKNGASISLIRPGKMTADYLERTLVLMSILGSAFLGALALVPSYLETLTGSIIFRGLGGSSILILVGVATDFARRLRAERLMLGYRRSTDFLR
jgi:preprotein translocase SecY subunit